MNSDDDDRVGYGKPPRQHRFKKGQSGNPKGRPRKPGDILEALQQELNGEITVTESGKRLRISRRQALAKAIVHNALLGDARMSRLLVQTVKNVKPAAPEFDILPNDKQALRELVDHIGETEDASDD